MEVAPIGLRDARISLGDGARVAKRQKAGSHGRDASPTKENEEKKPRVEVFAKQEMPLDLAAVHLAASLRRYDSDMDAITASRIAKQLLSHEDSWDRYHEQLETDQENLYVDELA